jgi:hypothetical protein
MDYGVPSHHPNLMRRDNGNERMFSSTLLVRLAMRNALPVGNGHWGDQKLSGPQLRLSPKHHTVSRVYDAFGGK